MNSDRDTVDRDFPTRDEVDSVADLVTPLPVRDLQYADWTDRSGDHRWRSLDLTYVPAAKPLAGWR